VLTTGDRPAPADLSVTQVDGVIEVRWTQNGPATVRVDTRSDGAVDLAPRAASNGGS
jgi:hypothetical protein